MPELRDLETNILIKGALDLPDSASNKKVSDSVLASDVPLSFWGGIDPLNGVVIDKLHPLVGQCVTDKVLCIPSGRGSCTASQVLLELILNDKAPRAIILRDLDPLVCVGAIIAEEVFDMHNLTILQIPEYQCFLEAVRVDGDSTMRLSELQLLKPAKDESPSSSSSSSSHSNDSRLALTHQEHNWLDNAASEAERIALRVIYRYARITGTKDYVPVSKAHIASEVNSSVKE